jgi:hypothetical protein
MFHFGSSSIEWGSNSYSLPAPVAQFLSYRMDAMDKRLSKGNVFCRAVMRTKWDKVIDTDTIVFHLVPHTCVPSRWSLLHLP